MHAACSHIFHPGKAFSPHQYHSDDLGPYRDKPSKYLGTDPFQHLNDEYDNGDEDTYTDTNKEQNRTKSRKRNLKNLVSGWICKKKCKSNSPDQNDRNTSIKKVAIDYTDIDEDADIYSIPLNGVNKKQ